MFGNRLQRARKALGLSLRDLGEKVALSHAAIKKYEDNLAMPSSEVLLRLARALRVKVEYFFRPGGFTLGKLQYRHTNMPKKQLDEIRAQIMDQVERRFELEDLFPSPPIQKFTAKDLSYKLEGDGDIEDIACKIRQQWNLGLDPIPDLVDLLEEQGIKVFGFDNSNHPNFDGLFSYVDESPLVVIGNQYPGDRQRFTLAHELGHLIFNQLVSCQLDEEQFCNRFAGAFLLPKESLIKILGEHRNNLEPRELSLLKQEFGISMTCILHRAEEAGIISHSLYRQLRAEFDAQGWSKQEPGEQYPKEEARLFEQMIFHALAEDYIGESKAAELMDISLDKLRSLRMMEHQDVTNR
jgi:Zn-dependent peptidase ImmA (M78 family)/DNA-binding XRE family transcriptional regulator